MIIQKSDKTILEQQRRHQEQKQINQKLSRVMMDMIISYLLSDNKSIRQKGYTNIQQMLMLLNRSFYRDDDDSRRLDVINDLLRGRLEYGIKDRSQLVDYINGNDPDYNSLSGIRTKEVSNNDVRYIDDTVTKLLNTAEFSYKIHMFEDMGKKFDEANPKQKEEILNNWKSLIEDSQNTIRSNTIENTEDDFVCIKGETFEKYAQEVYDFYSNPASKVATGMVGFNHILGGGFESGKVYCLFGLQGEGKSTTLLNLSYQIKEYNKRYKPKDPTKTPCVVYLTLENSKKETFSRLFSISTDAGRMTDYSAEECIDLMRSNGLVVNDENPIDLILKYKNNNSINTGYLYELYEDLSDLGYEVIAYVVDYLNLIRSVNRFSASEERLKLGSVVNELKAIASELKIPVITASQLNREANSKVDEARNKGKKNTVKEISRNNISESMQILNNLDGCYFLAPEYINNGEKKYLGVKVGKTRYQMDDIMKGHDSIHIPYTNPTSIKLVCDVGMKTPVYKFDLVEEEMNNSAGMKVDDNTKIPDNSHRCKNNDIIENKYEMESSYLEGCEGPSIVSERKRLRRNFDEYYKKTNPKRYADEQKMKIPEHPYIPEGMEPSKDEFGKYHDNNVYRDDNGRLLDYNPNWRDEPKFMGGKNVDAETPEHQMRIRIQANASINNSKKMEEELYGISRYTDAYTDIYDPYGSKEERLAHDYNLVYGTEFTPDEYWMLKEHFDKVKAGLLKEDQLVFSPYVHVKSTKVNPFTKLPTPDVDACMRAYRNGTMIN